MNQISESSHRNAKCGLIANLKPEARNDVTLTPKAFDVLNVHLYEMGMFKGLSRIFAINLIIASALLSGNIIEVAAIKLNRLGNQVVNKSLLSRAFKIVYVYVSGHIISPSSCLQEVHIYWKALLLICQDQADHLFFLNQTYTQQESMALQQKIIMIFLHLVFFLFFFFFKQKAAYELGTGDWSSDVCSSDLATRTSRALSSR